MTGCMDGLFFSHQSEPLPLNCLQNVILAFRRTGL